MRKIVIANVISNLEFGGAQRQLVELINHFDDQRFEMHVISLSEYLPLAANIKKSGVQIHVVKKGWKFDASVVPRLAALLQRLGTDIVQGYLYDAEIAARLAGTLAGVPVIVGSERNADYALRWTRVVGYRLTRPFRDACITNSVAGALFNRRELGYPPEHYVVIPNGVNTDLFQPRSRSAARAALGLEDRHFLVGMVASFKQQKNHPLLLRAARDLVRRFPEARLVFVGDQLHEGLHGSADYKTAIPRLIDELELAPYCVFLGNRPDVASIYPAFDVTVLPSLFEGTPNVALESMACGVPVIATDVSDNRAVIPDGRAGFITPSNDVLALSDRLLALAGDRELCSRLGDEARRWVEQEYSTRRLAERTQSAYESLIAAAAERRGAWRKVFRRICATMA